MSGGSGPVGVFWVKNTRVPRHWVGRRAGHSLGASGGSVALGHLLLGFLASRTGRE